jgi:hypothetical protein
MGLPLHWVGGESDSLLDGLFFGRFLWWNRSGNLFLSGAILARVKGLVPVFCAIFGE